MNGNLADKIGGFIGVFMIGAFVLGLAHSISTGAAGFWGGLPFWFIVVPVLGLVCYDFYSSSLRKKNGPDKK